MREIKFRIWGGKRKQRWYDKIIERAFGRPSGSIGQLPELPNGVVLTQCTGLKDKNSTEVNSGEN